MLTYTNAWVQKQGTGRVHKNPRIGVAFLRFVYSPRLRKKGEYNAYF